MFIITVKAHLHSSQNPFASFLGVRAYQGWIKDNFFRFFFLYPLIELKTIKDDFSRMSPNNFINGKNNFIIGKKAVNIAVNYFLFTKY